jgi:hypothetical protein
MPVSVGPGATAFTRIPDLAISSDAATALGLHRAHFVLHAQDHAENIGLERRSKAFRGLIRDRTDLPFGRSVVDRDIETAKPRDGLVDHGANLVFLADVGVDELGFRTERAQLLDEGLAGLIAPAGHDDLRALPGEGDGGSTADAGQGAGDQYDWVAHLPVPHVSCRRSMDCPTGKLLSPYGYVP